MSVLPYLFLLIIAWLWVLGGRFLLRFERETIQKTRYVAVDGLRGWLAISVFFHHAWIWFEFLQSSRWTSPTSNLITYFGGGSVMMFFMITAFLFCGKILDSKERFIDWKRLYISRILRIGPLYFFATFLAFNISGFVNGWDFKSGFLIRLASSLPLGVFGAPYVDHYVMSEASGPVMAGVTWTLPYEWLFYFSLPILAWLLRLRIPGYVWFGPFFVTLYQWKYQLSCAPLMSFVLGAYAAYLVRRDFKFKDYLCKFGLPIGIICAFVAIYFLDEPLMIYSQILLFPLFLCVVFEVSGVDFLTSRISRFLGDISFGIYLLHGVVIYLVVNIFAGRMIVGESLLIWWLLMCFASMMVLTLSYMAHVYIERPAIKGVDFCLNKLNNLINLKRVGL